MVFDENISEDVSLSKILDCFILENERPETIVDFLLQRKDCVDDILKYSIYSFRLLSTDFIAGFSISYIEKYIEVLKLSNDDVHSSLVAWQVLRSDFAKPVKDAFADFLKNRKMEIPHPYCGRSGEITRSIDGLFVKKEFVLSDIASRFNRMPDDEFYRITNYLDNSLWVTRIFSTEFFMGLSVQKQYIMIRYMISKIGTLWSKLTYVCYKFIVQILTEKIDVKIKYELYRRLISRRVIQENLVQIPENLAELIRSGESYPLFMINAQLYGLENVISYVVSYMLFNNRLDFLFSMLDTDRDVLAQHYDICDLLEYIRNNGLEDS